MSTRTLASLDVARATYRDISLYSPNRTPAPVDLSDNTNLWGVPPRAAAEIRDALSATITRYPALYVVDVKQAIADYLGVTPDMIVTGCGSDDVLDSAIRAFGEPDDLVAYPDPSFAMIPIFAQMNGLRSAPIPLTSTFNANSALTIAAQAKITYLCSPNNPTGTAFSRDTIIQIIDQAPGIVIIDEAYAEFATENCIELLQRSPRVVITRTLSKAFGLAGLRIGYAVGDPAIVAEIEKSRGPYKVNAVAARAAVAALTDDRPWVTSHVRDAIENRARFADALTQRGLAPIPSQANFILVPFDRAADADRRLRELGVAVRAFTALPNIGDALRISIGPWEMMDTCLRALDTVIQERAS